MFGPWGHLLIPSLYCQSHLPRLPFSCIKAKLPHNFRKNPVFAFLSTQGWALSYSGVMQLKPTQVWHNMIHTTMVEYLNSEIMKNSPQMNYSKATGILWCILFDFFFPDDWFCLQNYWSNFPFQNQFSRRKPIWHHSVDTVSIFFLWFTMTTSVYKISPKGLKSPYHTPMYLDH